MPPLKLAVIGAGPSAFYLTSRLLHLLRDTPASSDVRIHLYDRLWAPYGLVRYGVAPDHPEVKNCTHKFDVAASDPRVRFFGNVNIGVQPAPFPATRIDFAPTADAHLARRVSEPRTLQPHALPVPLEAILPFYTHLAFATGAPLPKLHPLLHRSHLCIPALDIVHWYTMHPSSPSVATFRSPIPPGTRHITIIGHGNVSLDIARILLTPPHRLATFDIPSHVLRALEDTWETLRQVTIVGRRGPREVRFTAKELREMMHLEDAVMRPIPAHIMSVVEADEGLSRQQARVVKLLKEGSKTGTAERRGGAGKTFSFEFWRSPTAYTTELSPTSRDARAVLQLEKTDVGETPGRVIGTGKFEALHTDLIVTSLGYEGDPSLFGGVNEGMQAHSDSLSEYAPSLPWFDASTGRIRTERGGGRVLTPDERVVRNVYATGWASRGASGVLAGTLLDANDVAASIVEDWKGDVEVASGPLARGDAVAGGLEGVPPVVGSGHVVEFEMWRRLEEEERRRGGGVKERERMHWKEVVHYLNQQNV